MSRHRPRPPFSWTAAITPCRRVRSSAVWHRNLRRSRSQSNKVFSFAQARRLLRCPPQLVRAAVCTPPRASSTHMAWVAVRAMSQLRSPPHPPTKAQIMARPFPNAQRPKSQHPSGGRGLGSLRLHFWPTCGKVCKHTKLASLVRSLFGVPWHTRARGHNRKRNNILLRVQILGADKQGKELSA